MEDKKLIKKDYSKYLAVALWLGATAFSFAETFSFVEDRFGTFKSCGCDFSPLGGLEREFEWQGQAQGKRFHFSAGTTFYNPYETIPKKDLSAVFELMALSLNELKTVAVSVSPFDLEGHCGALKKAKTISKFAWVASNLKTHEACTKLFTTFHELEGGKIKVLSLWEPISQSDNRKFKEVSWAKAEDALNHTLVASPPTITLIVLHHLPRVRVRELAKKFPGVNLWLGGEMAASSESIEQLGANSIAVSLMDQGREVGVVSLEDKPSTNLFNSDLNTRRLFLLGTYKNRIAELKERKERSPSEWNNELEKTLVEKIANVHFLETFPPSLSESSRRAEIEKVGLDKSFERPYLNPIGKLFQNRIKTSNHSIVKLLSK